MVLPSQTGRPPHARTNMKSPPRRRRGPALIGVLSVLIVVLIGVRLLLPDDPRTPAEPVAAVAVGPGNADDDAGNAPWVPAPVVAPPALAVAAAEPPRTMDAAGAAADEAVRQTPLARPTDRAGRRARAQMETGLSLAESSRPVEARQTLTAALESGALGPADAEFVRDVLGSLNHRLVFSPEVAPQDAFARAYLIAQGDRLSSIVGREALQVDWRFLVRVNRMASERSLRVGQRLKLVTGPFHAVVDKSEYRLDLYMGTGADRVFVRSFPVGLGEFDSTPVGRFQIRPDSKIINPAWANPRTGDRFDRDDPANPIGEHWIGLQGMDEGNRDLTGYGIHGTVDPETIGRQASMGCIRMLPEDVALVYEVLTEQSSTVEIRP